jgi:hypothetical protein
MMGQKGIIWDQGISSTFRRLDGMIEGCRRCVFASLGILLGIMRWRAGRMRFEVLSMYWRRGVDFWDVTGNGANPVDAVP